MLPGLFWKLEKALRLTVACCTGACNMMVSKVSSQSINGPVYSNEFSPGLKPVGPTRMMCIMLF